MAFAASGLFKLAGASGFNLWLYKTADATGTVDTAGYFNSASNVMNVGDVILRITYTDGTFAAVSTVGFHYVNSNTGGVVDVADTLAITATDTD